jgi:hypothetical protein
MMMTQGCCELTSAIKRFIFLIQSEHTIICCCMCKRGEVSRVCCQLKHFWEFVFFWPPCFRAQSSTKFYSNSGDLWPSIPLAVH